MGVRILSTDEGAKAAASKLATLHDAVKGIDANSGRVLHAIYKGTHKRKRLRKTDFKHLAALVARGYVQHVDEPGNQIQLTEDASYTFGP